MAFWFTGQGCHGEGTLRTLLPTGLTQIRQILLTTAFFRIKLGIEVDAIVLIYYRRPFSKKRLARMGLLCTNSKSPG
jgi:hypothetical protein